MKPVMLWWRRHGTRWVSRARRREGFTLIELMVVILIIGVLATLAVPRLLEASLRARVSEACTVLATFDKAQLTSVQETNEVGPTDALIMDDPCVNGFSKSFDYADNVTAGVASILYATGKGGLGDIGGQKIWSEVGVDLSVVHDHDEVYKRYAPSWK